MSFISKEFAKELSGKRSFRHSYQGAQTCTKIVRQIRAMRRQRGWSQSAFATRLKKPASNVSQRLENLGYTGFSLKTLLEVAEAFDVGLVVEFVRYKEFIRRTSDLSMDTLEVNEFQDHELDELAETIEDNAVTVVPVPVAPTPIATNVDLSSPTRPRQVTQITPILTNAIDQAVGNVWGGALGILDSGISGTKVSSLFSGGSTLVELPAMPPVQFDLPIPDARILPILSPDPSVRIV